MDEFVEKYVLLIKSFLAEEIDASLFEIKYLNAFKNEQAHMPTEEFRVLDRLFAEVDAYCSDPALRDENDLDEIALRKACARALGQLLPATR